MKAPAPKLADVDVPIACSLTSTAARTQLGEWHDVLAASVAAADRVSPAELSLRLRDDLDQLRAIIALAQREKACCPFFDFNIRIEAEAVRLYVSVPEDAAAILDEFASASWPSAWGRPVVSPARRWSEETI